jgi:hydroxymethylpyrimidine kinase/phosphomethylpyrimidine kinase
MKRILTIAGSDSGGGAGIQADIKTITVLGEYGLSVVTALTAQNTIGVQDVHLVPASFVGRQLDSVLSDIGADAVKTGMLASREIVEIVADYLCRYTVRPIVVDPVMVAKSGDSLLSVEARSAIKKVLFPIADIVTPNLPEAEVISGIAIPSIREMKEAARIIFDLGPAHVLIKGGHLKGDALDLLFDGKTFQEFSTPRLNQQNTHGTGCIFSAALASFLGKGLTVKKAVLQAKEFITMAIKAGIPIGSGHGPTNPYAYVLRK